METIKCTQCGCEEDVADSSVGETDPICNGCLRSQQARDHRRRSVSLSGATDTTDERGSGILRAIKNLLGL